MDANKGTTMKTLIVLIVLVVLTISLSGCVIDLSDKSGKQDRPEMQW